MDWSGEAQATLWGAGATFVTGLTAVIGAVVVGLRQADIQNRQASIAERQTKILDRQTALAELTLRKELFNDRLEVYQATYSFLAELLRDGFQPKRIKFTDIQNKFLDAKDRATFLFRPAVKEALDELWAAKIRGDNTELSMDRAGMRDDEFWKNTEENNTRRKWLREQFEHVADIFGSELKLSDHDMQLG